MFYEVQSPVVIWDDVGTLLEKGTVNINKSYKLKSPQPQATQDEVTSRLVTRFAVSDVGAAYI